MSARPDTPPLERMAYTAMEVPEILGVSYHYFSQHIAGELRWIRRGSKKIVSRTEIQRWLDENGARIFGD